MATPRRPGLLCGPSMQWRWLIRTMWLSRPGVVEVAVVVEEDRAEVHLLVQAQLTRSGSFMRSPLRWHTVSLPSKVWLMLHLQCGRLNDHGKE